MSVLKLPSVFVTDDRHVETLERIYIGCRFKSDTERQEKLFEMYTKMTTAPKSGVGKT